MARRPSEEPGNEAGRSRTRTEDRPRHAAPEAPVGYGNGPAIASLVVGLLGVTLAFLVFPAIAAMLLGIAAIILGALGMRNANQMAGLHKGLSVTGLVTGILALILGAAVLIGGVTLVDQFADQLQIDELQQQIDELGS